ncbi:PREDICTED: uncharacterized protein LOC106814450 [Priapulus caudatus]|uniref:Uncharacterized protein LOC106814450 n=1 Tax=Priapulus caudatus TaxID=37621 RepID=A0ABM1EPY3_PRICU|nr:PREDICTED: uncharacterized protein LOC106814450 [Priapulus caudatus]
MKAFKFPDVDDVTFTCQVNLCDRSQTCALQCEARDDIAEDAPIVANGNGKGNGNGDNRRRFKRDVLQVGRRLPTSSSSATTALPEPIQQMVGSVRVHAPGIETVGTTTVAPPDDVSRPRRRHCFTVSWVAACAAAFFAVLMIAITACMCLCARWRRLEKLQDHQKSSLESLSSPLATIHGLMNVCHIPRPSLINHPAPSIDKEGETNEVAPQTLTDRL